MTDKDLELEEQQFMAAIDKFYGANPPSYDVGGYFGRAGDETIPRSQGREPDRTDQLDFHGDEWKEIEGDDNDSE